MSLSPDPHPEWLVTTSPLINLEKLLSEWISNSKWQQLIELALDTNNIRSLWRHLLYITPLDELPFLMGRG
jgi:hypothetical protein